MDVKKASLMKEKKHPEYAIILAFDVKVNKDAQTLADKDKIPIFTADIIYHLFDRFTKHMEDILQAKKSEAKDEAVFPVIMKIDSQCIIRQKNPMIFGMDILDGQLRVGTPLCIPDKKCLEVGRVIGIEKDKKPVQMARKGQKVSVKIEQNSSQTHITYGTGKNFDHTNHLYSKITRSSIDSLKEVFRDEMKNEDWSLIRGLKKICQIE